MYQIPDSKLKPPENIMFDNENSNWRIGIISIPNNKVQSNIFQNITILLR